MWRDVDENGGHRSRIACVSKSGSVAPHKFDSHNNQPLLQEGQCTHLFSRLVNTQRSNCKNAVRLTPLKV